MKHEEIKAKLGAFADNEAKDHEKREIEAHLETCTECRAEIETIEANREILRRAISLEPSADFRARLNAKIDATTARRRVFDISKLIPVPIALSLIVLIASAFFVAAPFIYASNDNGIKLQSNAMAANALIAGMTGSIFAPAAFAKFCDACSANICECCGDKCGENCKMKKGGK